MKDWLRSGLVWGGILYIFTIMLLPLMSGEKLSFFKIIMGIPLWIITGIAIGFIFKKKKKQVKKTRKR